jgi:hypothetical protein
MEDSKYELDSFIKKYAKLELKFSHYHDYEFYFKATKVPYSSRNKVEITAKIGGSPSLIENLTIGANDSRNFEDVKEHFSHVTIRINGKFILSEDIENN